MKQRAKQLLQYINKVYRFNQFLQKLHDRRISPTISNDLMIAVIFLGIVTCKGSFNQIEEHMRDGYFNKPLKKKLKRGSAETFGNVLQASNVEQFEEYNAHLVRKARYNKALRGGTIDGFNVVALDGTELTRTASNQRSCNCCRTTERAAEDGSKIIQKHENFVGASYVGKPPNLVLGLERMAPGEGETTATLRLLDKIKSQHYYYADIVTLDSLYAKTPVINKLIEQNIFGVIRVKQKNFHVIKDAEGLFRDREPEVVKKRVSIKSDWYDEDTSGKKYLYDVKIWDEEGFTTWQKVKKSLRVLQIEETRVNRKGQPLDEPLITYLITTAGKEVITTETLWRILHRRWDVENKTFHGLKKYWSFGHDFHHEDNAFLVMRWLIVIAVNLFLLFFFRHLRAHTKNKTQKGLAESISNTLIVTDISIWEYG